MNTRAPSVRPLLCLNVVQREQRPLSVPTALALTGGGQTALLLTDAGTERVYCFRRDKTSGALEPQCSLAVESPTAMLPVAWPL